VPYRIFSLLLLLLLLLQVCAMPEGVVAAVAALDPAQLQPYSKGSPAGIIRQIDTLMGLS
jgi:hypothetical protein